MEERIKKLETEVKNLKEVVRKFSLIIDKLERGTRSNRHNMNNIETRFLNVIKARDDR